MPLYEVAIIKKPTAKEAEEGKSEELILPPKAVIADDERSASVKAVAENQETIGDTDLGRVEVLARPFA